MGYNERKVASGEARVVGVSHNRARTSGEQPKENSKTPDRGTVIIPKL